MADKVTTGTCKVKLVQRKLETTGMKTEKERSHNHHDSHTSIRNSLKSDIPRINPLTTNKEKTVQTPGNDVVLMEVSGGIT